MANQKLGLKLKLNKKSILLDEEPIKAKSNISFAIDDLEEEMSEEKKDTNLKSNNSPKKLTLKLKVKPQSDKDSAKFPISKLPLKPKVNNENSKPKTLTLKLRGTPNSVTRNRVSSQKKPGISTINKRTGSTLFYETESTVRLICIGSTQYWVSIEKKLYDYEEMKEIGYIKPNRKIKWLKC